MVWMFDRIKYDLDDLMNKSYAEKQRDFYKKIIKDIKKQLKDTQDIDWARQDLNNDMNQMEINSDSAEGKLKTTFDSRQEIVKTEMNNLLDGLADSIDTINEKLKVLNDEYEYWNREVYREDMVMESYSESDYKKMGR